MMKEGNATKFKGSRNLWGGQEVFTEKVKLKIVEDGTSYRGNGLGSENEAGMGKPCSEDNEEIGGRGRQLVPIKR